MSSYNQVMLLGHVGTKNIKTIANGVKVCNLSVATNQRGYTKKNGEVVEERTDWHNVVCWRSLAEVCDKFVKVGSQVHIIGELRNRTWQDKEGRTHVVTEVMANTLTLVGSGKGMDNAAFAPQTATEQTAEQTKEEHKQPFENTNTDDDLPF
jgi:single-strand DNA-binding protein